MDKIYNDYDNFAYFYNKYWTVNVPFYLKIAVEILMPDEIEKDTEILDVCCGTGSVASLFEKDGFHVTGIDGSSSMLIYAKENAPLSTFIHDDARNFNLNKKFKLITCLFDSLNHILEKDDLLKVFQNIYNHLDDKGSFIFDINSLQSSEDASLSDFSHVEENSVFISKGDYNSKNKLITFNVTYFVKENNCWNRHDTVIYERYYSEKIIKELLKKSGFTKIYHCYGEDLGIEPFEDRIFWRVNK